MISWNMKKLRANIVHLQIDEEIWKKAFIDPESFRELQGGSAGPFSKKTNGFWAQASIQIMQHIVLATIRSWTLQSNYSAS